MPRPALAIALAGALAGCAHRPRPPAPVPVPAAAPPPPSADGTYSGPSRLMMADGRGCPRSAMQEVTVFDRGFDVPYREGRGSPQPVHAAIAPDNSISGGDGLVNIAGRLEESGVLNLTVANDRCQSHMVLRRR